MNLIKDIVKEQGIYDIIIDYKYNVEVCEKYNKVLEELCEKTRIRSKHIVFKLTRNRVYRYNRYKPAADTLIIHNIMTDIIWRIYNYGRGFYGRAIITKKVYCDITPIIYNYDNLFNNFGY